MPGRLSTGGRLGTGGHLGTGGRQIDPGGAYQQLVGWSPGGDYLLAGQGDGRPVVIDFHGKIVPADLNNLPHPPFWAVTQAGDGLEDGLVIARAGGAFELLSFPLLQSQPLLEPGSLGADGLANVRRGPIGEFDQ